MEMCETLIKIWIVNSILGLPRYIGGLVMVKTNASGGTQ